MSDLPKVLLLGDSIRISYQPHVARLLAGRATVVGPAENCQTSLYTLSSLNRWIDELGEPVVVHWNNGLHDAGTNPDRSPRQIPMAMYTDNLALILRRLRTITPDCVWATSTPVHPDYPCGDTHWSWRNEDIDRYNAAARAVMEEAEVPINDLHRRVWENRPQFLSEDRLHLSEAGQRKCATDVAACISTFLK